MATDLVFYKKGSKKSNLRSKRISENQEDDEESLNILHSLKELQHLRKKPRGISNETLDGENLSSTNVNQLQDDDMYKLKVGGLINLATISKEKKKSKFNNTKEDDIELDIGTGFSKETNRRDEDAEMVKYIEEELEKRKGKKDELYDFDKRFQNANDALYYVSDHLKKSYTKKSEEMMSNQMLCGIPEVNLGIESKIANIEATELEKQRVEAELASKKKATPSFVPTNIAVNFVQHDRFSIETDRSYYVAKRNHELQYGSKGKGVKDPKDEQQVSEPKVVMESDDDYPTNEGHNSKFKINQTLKAARPPTQQTQTSKKRINPEKATDDFYFERYRKQFQRH